MTHRKHTLSAVAMLGLAGSLAIVGCKGEEPEPVAQTKTVKKAPPPPAPKLATVEELKAKHGIDDRVMMEEDEAPSTEEERVAVLKFFHAFAVGDSDALQSMMTVADRYALEEMVENGQWAESTGDAVYAIEVRTGSARAGDCALALIEVMDNDDQPQMWYYEENAGRFRFEAVSTPPDILDRLSGADWIQAWHDVIAEELALADEPDDVYEIPQVNLDDGDSGSSGAPSGGPAAAPGRNMPTGPSRGAPGRGTNPAAPGGR
ncbi:MAG: hypothetical protein AAF432_05810 [Planctomycetota bacterium]